jgi:F0F1-type ATP synthase assembly protein I
VNSFFQKTITDTQNSAEDAAAKKKKKRKLIGWAVGSTLISIIVLGVGLGVGMRNIF